MRLAAASLIIAAARGAQVQAQTAPQPEAPSPAPTTQPTPVPAPPPVPASPPAQSPAVAPTPSAGPEQPSTAPSAPAPAAPAPETPPPPPAPPTDPVAIELLDTLQNICVPAVAGGNMAALTKSAGYRKSGDNFVYKGKGFQLTVESPGSNPSQCHVDIVHPADPAAPAQPMVIALHNWAAIERDYSLYRNDKNVNGSVEYTTRSWEHTADGKHQALVLTTMRKADGSPARGASDTSEMIFSEIPAT